MELYFSKQAEMNNVIRSVRAGETFCYTFTIQRFQMKMTSAMETFHSILMSDTFLKNKTVHYFVHIARLNNEQIHKHFINSCLKYRRCGYAYVSTITSFVSPNVGEHYHSIVY
jgi:phosphopantetheine adenylyltransferase